VVLVRREWGCEVGVADSVNMPVGERFVDRTRVDHSDVKVTDESSVCLSVTLVDPVSWCIGWLLGSLVRGWRCRFG
jgi:hypothetical protein